MIDWNVYGYKSDAAITSIGVSLTKDLAFPSHELLFRTNDLSSQHSGEERRRDVNSKASLPEAASSSQDPPQAHQQ